MSDEARANKVKASANRANKVKANKVKVRALRAKANRVRAFRRKATRWLGIACILIWLVVAYQLASYQYW